MVSDLTLQLIAFFVATAIAIVSSHIGLIRLIGNEESDGAGGIASEKPGVLIVVEFALVILICAPLPLLTKMLSPPGANHFFYANWIIPFATLALAALDMWIAKSRAPGAYYRVVGFFVMACSIGLIIANVCGQSPCIALFFLALGLPVIVIAAQFLKSALRFAGYVK